MRWSGPPFPPHLQRRYLIYLMNIEGFPPLSTVWVGGAVLLSLLEKFGFVSEYQMAFSVRSILERQQYWRLITTFMYFGPFDINLLFKFLFYVRFTFMLELDAYSAKKRAEHIWLVFVSSLSILLISLLVPMRFLSEPLSFVLMYIWCRRNRHLRVGFFGLVMFNAPYLLFVDLGIMMMRNTKEAIPIAIGIAVGHICSYKQGFLTHRRIFDRTMAS